MKTTEVPASNDPILDDREERLIERLRKEEGNRYINLCFALGFAAMIFLLTWQAPFAMCRIQQLPYSEVSKGLYDQARSFPGWLAGVFCLVRGTYDAFFNRRRKLLLKLAGQGGKGREA